MIRSEQQRLTETVSPRLQLEGACLSGAYQLIQCLQQLLVVLNRFFLYRDPPSQQPESPLQLLGSFNQTRTIILQQPLRQLQRENYVASIWNSVG